MLKCSKLVILVVSRVRSNKNILRIDALHICMYLYANSSTLRKINPFESSEHHGHCDLESLKPSLMVADTLCTLYDDDDDDDDDDGDDDDDDDDDGDDVRHRKCCSFLLLDMPLSPPLPLKLLSPRTWYCSCHSSSFPSNPPSAKKTEIEI